MRHLLMTCLAIATLATTAQAAPAGDLAAGEQLHAANCTSCHNTDVYTRKDRRIGSLDALNAQLQSCSHMAKKEFSPTEVRNLTKFLNDRFYHFK
jgi:cytochrome c553